MAGETDKNGKETTTGKPSVGFSLPFAERAPANPMEMMAAATAAGMALSTHFASAFFGMMQAAMEASGRPVSAKRPTAPEGPAAAEAATQASPSAATPATAPESVPQAAAPVSPVAGAEQAGHGRTATRDVSPAESLPTEGLSMESDPTAILPTGDVTRAGPVKPAGKAAARPRIAKEAADGSARQAPGAGRAKAVVKTALLSETAVLPPAEAKPAGKSGLARKAKGAAPLADEVVTAATGKADTARKPLGPVKAGPGLAGLDQPSAPKPLKDKPVVAKPAGRKKAASQAVEAGDDLKAIAGIGPKLAELLAGMGVRRYAQIAAWTQKDVEQFDRELGLDGRIAKDDWIAQAKALLR
ncbi:hypothetical protein [Rhizobium sp. SSA_523]|uniref:hypothetical protein n=1 Tax=Rhizobium sp. SSA_523 TaxID=2952477 RepID=UPI002091CE61|nr:hypothetical protein [Rhizobium sp. SSA_523]MCO5730643.1 hypothetical protein [Rhizobium sp. SSA_523]WKC24527.1 hypothetical protein QTJ18_10775 [Rhizobium sp. SSA_523]